MRKIILLIIIAILSTTSSAIAQVSQKAAKAILKGVVLDDATGQPLVGCIVVVQGTSQGSITDSKGAFVVKNVNKGKEVNIEVSYVGYLTQVLKVNTKNDIYQFAAPIRMKQSEIKIKDITVHGSAPVAKMKGDTTLFSAGAYKVNPDATAGDLLSKMPGFEKNDDGTVSQQGEKVQRVYVDGKSFFKNDLSAALNALPAGLIDGIELFDDKSDKSKFTGFDDGSTVKSINIVTKNRQGAKPTGLFEASLGYGYDEVYMSSVNFTRLSGNRQYSIMAGSNNINIQPVQQRRGFGRGGGSGGINTQSAVAMNFTNSFKNDGEVALFYGYDRSDITKRSYQNRTYFPSKDYTNYIYQTTDSTKNVTNNHKFSLDLQGNLSEKIRITFRPTGSISYSDNYSKSFNNSMMDGDTTRNDRVNTSTPDNYSIGGDLSIMRKFTENNFITFGFNGRLQGSNSDSYLVGETIYDRLENESDTVAQHQMSENISNTNNVGFSAEYSQRVSLKSGVSFNYELGYNWSDNDKRTYLWDELEGRYVDLDSTLSNNFQRNYMTNNAGARYNYKTDATTFNFSAQYQNAQMINDKLFPDTYKREYSFDGVVINSQFRYRKSKEGGNVTISYRGTPNYPSVTQLQDVLNNDNPLQLSSGNPNLRQSFNNDFRLRYHNANMQKSLFYGGGLSVSNTINGFVNNTVLYQEDGMINIGGEEYKVRQGAQYTSPINMNGSWSARASFMLSFPVEVLKVKINLMGMYGFNNRPSMYNNVKYSSQENNFRFNFGFNSNITPEIDFSINNDVNYSMSKSNRIDDSNSFSDDLRTSVNWIIWKGFFVNVDYTMRYQRLSNTPLERPYTNMLNGSVGKKFFNNKFEVRASVYDALNQNINIQQTVSDIYVAETISNNLTRYFSLSLTYKFNSMTKNMNEMRMRGGMPGGHGGHGGRRTM